MSLKNQATSGFIWTFAQQFGHHIIGFVVSLVLARILLPAEFGLIGMISILVGLARVLVDAGLTQSLIRQEECDQEDYSTVFFFNLIASFFVYALIFFLAPLIANFYGQEILTQIIRLYCLIFIVNAFSAVQTARLTKNMNFKTQTLVAIPANVIGGAVGIYMAYAGFGVFSLVWSTIVTSTVATIQLWFYTGWKPSFLFSVSKFKDHFNYGYKLTLSGVLEVISKNSYIIIIGKFFSAGQVGFYTRAETMKQLPVTNISSALNKVTFPLFAQIQNDDIRLKRIYQQLMQMVLFILTPALLFMAALGEPLFRFLFTEKWLPAVPYFQILCVTGILKPIHGYNLNVLKVKGRSDLYLKVKTFEKLIIVVGLIVGIQFGILGILYSQVAVSVLMFFVNAHQTNKFIDYSAYEQFKTVVPILLLSVISAVVVRYMDVVLFFNIDFIRIIGSALTGVLFYILIGWLFKMESYILFRKVILNYVHKGIPDKTK